MLANRAYSDTHGLLLLMCALFLCLYPLSIINSGWCPLPPLPLRLAVPGAAHSTSSGLRMFNRNQKACMHRSALATGQKAHYLAHLEECRQRQVRAVACKSVQHNQLSARDSCIYEKQRKGCSAPSSEHTEELTEPLRLPHAQQYPYSLLG